MEPEENSRTAVTYADITNASNGSAGNTSTAKTRWGHHFNFVEVFRESFPSCPRGDGNP
jgi:hypothetical protein